MDEIIGVIPRKRILDAQLNDIIEMLPERLPQDLSRLLYAKSELEFLLETYRLGVRSGAPEPFRSKLLEKIEVYRNYLEEVERCLKFERERSAFFPKPGQTMEVTTGSALHSLHRNPTIVGSRTAAGINIWRFKSYDNGIAVVEIQDERICGLCGQDGEDVHYLKCGNCRRIRYCGKSCQRAHWKDHKAVCELREM